MNAKKIGFYFIVLVAFAAVGFYYSIVLQKENFEQRRTQILNDLSLATKEAKSQGRYFCCAEPPCKMCYTGSWLWADGICRCDEMEEKGELDKVCYECRELLGCKL